MGAETDRLVIIPTYNEKENIEKMIDTVFALSVPFHLLIIDDGSPDGTANLVKAKMQEYPGQLFIEERTGKLGLGTAYIHGFKWALARHYNYICEMDADFSHNPEDLIRLWEAAKSGKGDLVVGTRYIKGGNVKNWPWSRVLISFFASVYVRMVTWIPSHDTTAGFVCFKRQVLETIDLDAIKFIGYAFQIEMKFTAWKHGFKIGEVPITFIDRVEGTSKMSSSIIKEAVFGVLQLQWESFFKTYKKPKKK